MCFCKIPYGVIDDNLRTFVNINICKYTSFVIIDTIKVTTFPFDFPPVIWKSYYCINTLFLIQPNPFAIFGPFGDKWFKAVAHVYR